MKTLVSMRQVCQLMGVRPETVERYSRGKVSDVPRYDIKMVYEVIEVLSADWKRQRMEGLAE